MSFSIYKRVEVPDPNNPDGGTKFFRVFLPGMVISLLIGLEGFVWLLVLREWMAALVSPLIAVVATLGIMGLATPPNLRLFEVVDESVVRRDDRTLFWSTCFECYFLHAARILGRFLSFAAPVLLLKDAERGMIAASLLGFTLADPPLFFIVDESTDEGWHATFNPFCHIVALTLAIGAGALRLPIRSLVGPVALASVASIVVMACHNLRRYRKRMAEYFAGGIGLQGSCQPDAANDPAGNDPAANVVTLAEADSRQKSATEPSRAGQRSTSEPGGARAGRGAPASPNGQYWRQFEGRRRKRRR